MLCVCPKHNWFDFCAGFLLLKVASAVGSPGEALGGKQGLFFFYPTASSTVAFRNGTDSLKRHLPEVPSQEEDRAVSRTFQQTWRGRSGKMERLSVPRRPTGDSLRENYCPNNSKQCMFQYHKTLNN